jgi:hypothetical protein
MLLGDSFTVDIIAAVKIFLICLLDLFSELIIITPTMIRAGAVAAPGIARKIGLRKRARAKQTAVEKAVRPVRPPSPIPEALST